MGTIWKPHWRWWPGSPRCGTLIPRTQTSAVRVLRARLSRGDKKRKLSFARQRAAARISATFGTGQQIGHPSPNATVHRAGTVSDGAGTPHGHLDPAAPLVMVWKPPPHLPRAAWVRPLLRSTPTTRFLSGPRIVTGRRGTPTSIGRLASSGTIGPHDAGKQAGMRSASRCKMLPVPVISVAGGGRSSVNRICSQWKCSR